MTFHIESLTAPPDSAEIEPLLRAYYAQIRSEVHTLGGPDAMTDAAAIQNFWEQIETFMPPAGRLCLARDAQNRPVGCGSLSVPAAGTGELKRLFVSPQMRGAGLGRSLVTFRISAAREMGLQRLRVDTIRSTVAMQAIYKSLGFVEIPQFPESSTANAFPELVPVMRFFEKRL